MLPQTDIARKRQCRRDTCGQGRSDRARRVSFHDVCNRTARTDKPVRPARTQQRDFTGWTETARDSWVTSIATGGLMGCDFADMCANCQMPGYSNVSPGAAKVIYRAFFDDDGRGRAKSIARCGRMVSRHCAYLPCPSSPIAEPAVSTTGSRKRWFPCHGRGQSQAFRRHLLRAPHTPRRSFPWQMTMFLLCPFWPPLVSCFAVGCSRCSVLDMRVARI